MAQFLNCGYSRVAIRELGKKHANRSGHVQFQADEYNHIFGGYPHMQITGNPKYISDKCKDLNALFSRKWPNQESVQQYLSTFSKQWEELPLNEKNTHCRTSCPVCPTKYGELTQAFPVTRKRVLEKSQVDNVHVHVHVEQDLNLPPTKKAKYIGENLAKVLDPACQQLTGMTLATVLQQGRCKEREL